MVYFGHKPRLVIRSIKMHLGCFLMFTLEFMSHLQMMEPAPFNYWRSAVAFLRRSVKPNTGLALAQSVRHWAYNRLNCRCQTRIGYGVSRRAAHRSMRKVN